MTITIYEIKERKNEKERWKWGRKDVLFEKRGQCMGVTGENMINLAKEIGNWFIKISFRYKLISYFPVGHGVILANYFQVLNF